MANQLDQEKSLYLSQHAHHLVHWYPWGDEAFAKAQAEDKPILVSVGYSSCHWCHVMAHECFEDEYIASLMNEHFVCIKVDREERPDVDQIYMEAVQMITGRGGWPLNVFCLPDGRPFFGGTYFPPDDRGHGIVPWPQLLMRISDHYKKNRADLEENAGNIEKNLEHSNVPLGEPTGDFPLSNLLTAAQGVCQSHDDATGGFGPAPKFPLSMVVDFLLQVRLSHACEDHPTLPNRIDEVVQTTLNHMAYGGLFDQIGGGFTRYSVDDKWKIPHFEKMLYDNALLIDAYTKAYTRYQNPLYKGIVQETCNWLETQMRGAEGLYYTAIDADSEGKEGAYYVWTPSQVTDVLGQPQADEFCEAYDITETGNFEEGTSNPHFISQDHPLRQKLEPMRAKLLAARSKRSEPSIDQKYLLSSNSLLIRGLSEAGFYLNLPDLLKRARALSDTCWNVFFSDDKLYGVCYEGELFERLGSLQDYSYFIEGLLSLAAKVDLLEKGASEVYLKRAEILMDQVLAKFVDSDSAGFFFTDESETSLIVRKKEWLDNAIPASNASLIHSLSALYALTGKQEYAKALQPLRNAYAAFAKRVALAAAHGLSAITCDAVGVCVIKVSQVDDWEPLRAALSQKPWRKIFLKYEEGADQPAGYQLCVGTQCLEPTFDLQLLADKL